MAKKKSRNGLYQIEMVRFRQKWTTLDRNEQNQTATDKKTERNKFEQDLTKLDQNEPKQANMLRKIRKIKG